MRLSKEQKLYLRLIVATGCWTPIYSVLPETIPDGSGDEVQNAFGSSKKRILKALIKKELISDPHGLGFHLLRPTELGIETVKGLSK